MNGTSPAVFLGGMPLKASPDRGYRKIFNFRGIDKNSQVGALLANVGNRLDPNPRDA
jgi:hypothetical protein